MGEMMEFRTDRLTHQEIVEGATAYEASSQGVRYRVVGTIVNSVASGRRTFRAYRITEDGKPFPAHEGGQHKTRAAAFAQCEADLLAVLADRATANAAAAAEDEAPETITTSRGLVIRVKLEQASDGKSRLQTELAERVVRRAKYEALKEVLAALDGWIEGARDNHEAAGHRDKECCLAFYSSDIRAMVNDAATVLGIAHLFKIEPGQ